MFPAGTDRTPVHRIGGQNPLSDDTEPLALHAISLARVNFNPSNLSKDGALITKKVDARLTYINYRDIKEAAYCCSHRYREEMALRSAVVVLMLLYSVCGMPTLNLPLSIGKRQADPDAAAIKACAVKDVSVSSVCRDAAVKDPPSAADITAICSSTCDSLYLAAVRCAGSEILISLAYSKLCTNGYHGPGTG